MRLTTRKRVRIHTDSHSIEGVIVARRGEFITLADAERVAGAERSEVGTVYVPKARIAFIQVVAS